MCCFTALFLQKIISFLQKTVFKVYYKLYTFAKHKAEI